jgi:hypothetical protein
MLVDDFVTALFVLVGIAVLAWAVVVLKDIVRTPWFSKHFGGIVSTIFAATTTKETMNHTALPVRFTLARILPLIFWLLIILPMVLYPIIFILFYVLGIPWSFLLPVP